MRLTTRFLWRAAASKLSNGSFALAVVQLAIEPLSFEVDVLP
jgi:hypothetical protein